MEPKLDATPQATSQAQDAPLRIPCEVYSRVVGYLRPLQNWNQGKQQEFHERRDFRPPETEVAERPR